MKKGKPVVAVMAELQVWRNRVYQRDWEGSVWAPCAILSDDMVRTLASVGPYTSRTVLDRAIGGRGGWMSRYCDSLYALLSSLEMPEVVEESCSERKEQERASDNVANSSDAGVNERRKRGDASVEVSSASSPRVQDRPLPVQEQSHDESM
jgi:hypothetical protein